MIKKQPELATVIKMQKETPDVYDEVLTAVKNYLLQPETDRQKKVREKLEKAKTKLKKKGNLEEKLKQQGDTNLSFQVCLFIYELCLSFLIFLASVLVIAHLTETSY